MAWQQGGYFPESHLIAGAVCFVLLAVLLAVRPPGFGMSTPALTGVAALAGLAAWTGLSSRWSSAPDAALESFQLALVHVGMLGLGVVAAGSGRYSRHVVWAVLAVVATVACAGLVSRLYPDVLDPAAAFSRFAGYRLAYPFGYWNAFGALGAMGVVLAIGLASDLRSPAVLRALAAGLVVPVGTAAYLSFSRGAWLAFFAGLIVLVAVSSPRLPLLVTLGICGVALAACIGRVTGYDALTENRAAGRGVIAEGREFGPFVLAMAVLAGVARGVLVGAWVPVHARARLLEVRRRLGYAAGVAVILVAATFYALRSDAVEGTAAARIESAERWIGREWDEFMTPAAVGELRGSARLTTARGTRSDLYRVAIDGFESDPLLGDGAGGFEYRFAHDRRVSEKVRDAHSLYLETLGELGLPGLLLLLAFIGSVAWAAVVARLRRDSLSATQAAAASAAFAVWAVHAGVDWDWQVPALTGPALLLAAALYPVGRRGIRRRGGSQQPPDALLPSRQRHRSR